MSDCCIDYTSAAHLSAEAIVKVGDTCCTSLDQFCEFYPLPYHDPDNVELVTANILKVAKPTASYINLVSESSLLATELATSLSSEHAARSVTFYDIQTQSYDGTFFCIDLPSWKTTLISLLVKEPVYSWNDSVMTLLPSMRIRSKR